MTAENSEVQRLAAQLTIFRNLAIGAAVVAATALAVAALAVSRSLHVELPTGPSTLDAAEVTVRDPAGNLRGRWSTQGISLADRTGRMRAGISLSDEGVPSFTLFSKTGAVRAVIGLGTEDLPAITLHDQASRVRTRILVGDGDAPSVTVADAQGNVVGRFPAPATTPPARKPSKINRRTGR